MWTAVFTSKNRWHCIKQMNEVIRFRNTGGVIIYIDSKEAEHFYFKKLSFRLEFIKNI